MMLLVNGKTLEITELDPVILRIAKKLDYSKDSSKEEKREIKQ